MSLVLPLDRAARSDDPFPHLVLDNALPSATFDVLTSALPAPERFAVKGRGLKLELDIADSAVQFAALPSEHRRILADLRDLVRGAAPAIATVFASALQRKYTWLLGEDIAAEVLGGGWTTTNGRVMGRAPGYQLGPHLDSSHTGVTCLFYFSSAVTEDEGALGLYRPEREPDVLDASTYYPDRSEGIASQLARTIAIRPNLFVAFANTPVSLHGFQRAPGATGWRFVYQCHIVPATLTMDEMIPRLDAARRRRWHRYDD